MRKLIHKLRQKPEAERRHILHILIFVAGVIMIILWAYSLGRSFTSPETKIKAKQDLQPFSILKNNLIDGYKSVPE